MAEFWQQDNTQVQKIQEALKKASKDVPIIPISIESLLDLHSEENNTVSDDPSLSKLSQLLSNLQTLLEKLEKLQGYSIKSFILRQLTNYEISKVVTSIEKEINSWIDREVVQKLVRALERSSKDDEKIEVLADFQKRVSRCFDRDLQDLILRAKIFNMLEMLLCDTCSNKVREQCAFVISELVQFNRDVFVGLVLMGPTVRALVSMSTYRSIQVLCSLVKLIKGPLVDELDSNGQIPIILDLLLGSKDVLIQVAAMDCILEIAYFARKEVIEAMIEKGLVEKLVEWQRLDSEGELRRQCREKEVENEEELVMEDNPFERCVARFAVQIEVGEKLVRRERRELKMEILRRVREASGSEAEAATILAEVLWGSSP